MAEPRTVPAGQQRLGAARARAAVLSRGLGSVAYGALFCVVLPAALALWAVSVPGLERLPAYRSTAIGAALLAAGALLWAGGVGALLRHGAGLPMNAYPTHRFVHRGVYRVLADPIYVGFALLVAGTAVATGSAPGLWLVLPVTSAAMAALVIGWERPQLRARFGARPAPWLSLPRDDEATPRFAERAAAAVLAFGPWLLAWLAVQGLGVPADAFELVMPLDARVPLLAWTEPVYASCYLVPVVLLALRTRRALRDFVITAWLATGVVLLCWLVVPVVAVPKPVEVRGGLDALLAYERRWSNGTAALPSFHVLWALFAAAAVARARPRWRLAAWTWGAAVTVSCATTGMHNIADLVAALALYPLLARPDVTWEWLRGATEQVANSWREWRIGAVRIIDHGIFAGLGAGVALLAMLLLVPHATGTGVLIALAGLVGAGLWAQAIESGWGLARPFGYYGAVFGCSSAALALEALGLPGLEALAALALAAPWTQALGRVRCLIQGCCHGAPTTAAIGIRHTHPRSRVCYLAHLDGQPVHPTALYSILANVVLGLLLLRLWIVAAPLALITGLYLVGNGVSRFAEEAYRGEPQTPVLLGMRLYQWLAILCVAAGAVITNVASAPAPVPQATSSLPALIIASAFAALTTFAMGVDFPASKRRFSRLASP